MNEANKKIIEQANQIGVLMQSVTDKLKESDDPQKDVIELLDGIGNWVDDRSKQPKKTYSSEDLKTAFCDGFVTNPYREKWAVQKLLGHTEFGNYPPHKMQADE